MVRQRFCRGALFAQVEFEPLTRGRPALRWECRGQYGEEEALVLRVLFAQLVDDERVQGVQLCRGTCPHFLVDPVISC